jgi:CheY-like chemotaxis protein
VEASDGRDALAKALMRPPSLVIMEIRLPLLDGFALCEILRRDRATAHVPIVVVTAEEDSVQLERVRKVGADVVLTKPTPIETILDGAGRLMAASKSDKRTARKKTYSRFVTTTPAAPAPDLLCPACDRSLTYEWSHIGGVSERYPEQWDYYVCPACRGTLQYRHRTRKLRAVDDVIE